MIKTKYERSQVEQALKKHDKRIDVALSLGCSPTYVNRLINETYRDLKHLAKWKIKSKKIWNSY